MRKKPGAPRSKFKTKIRPRVEHEAEFESETEAEYVEPRSAARTGHVEDAFVKLWESLFTTPVHLDSALSKLTPSLKRTLAGIIPAILLRPASQAEALGIGIPEGEPWNLPKAKLARWSPARQIAMRTYEGMSGRMVLTEPMAEDFPPRMLEEWTKAFGEETARKLVSVLGGEPPLSLRANRKVGSKGLLSILKEGSKLPVKVQASDLSPSGVRLGGYAAIMGLPVYQEGGFEIQDEGSQLMALFALWPSRYAPFLSEKPGPVRVPKEGVAPLPPVSEVPAWTVVDACAGAGGKSLAFADALGNRGRVFAYDTVPAKLQALKRRAKRAGVTNIQAVEVKEGHEAEVTARFRARADVVLVDAPCSGWGVLRRNPDIKWRQDPETLKRMPEIQKRLLKQYSELVAPGGRLVFGVCTFRPEETREIVESFLKDNPEFTAREGGYLGPGPCDGFFMQAFQRKKAKGGDA